jgi:hypothetical protein
MPCPRCLSLDLCTITQPDPRCIEDEFQRPMTDFMKLTKIPIIIFYGDFIPEKPSDNPGQDGWRARLEVARKWRDTVNRPGGDVTVVHLPEVVSTETPTSRSPT